MFFSILFLFLSQGELYAAQDFSVYFTDPDFAGDFYLSGNIVFPPSAVKSEENVLVKFSESGEEVPSRVTVLRKWADGYLLRAEIIFAANSSLKRNYLISYGEDIKRRKVFYQTAVLPTVSFSVVGSPKTAENVNLDVGQINVRVDKSPKFYYYWHMAPIILIILFSYLRYRRTRASYED